MPVRSSKPKKIEQPTQYSYEYLLRHIRSHIDKDLDGVAGFLNSPKFEECGFKNTPNERAKMFTYLSLPKEGETVKVKSFPVLQKLYNTLLGVSLESKMVVTRTQVISSEAKI